MRLAFQAPWDDEDDDEDDQLLGSLEFESEELGPDEVCFSTLPFLLCLLSLLPFLAARKPT